MAKILVVDDSPDVLLLCKVHMQYDGHDVTIASDGFEALDKIRVELPDLVLLDIMMPGMDGWEVLASIKSDPATSSIPVVMLTARGDGLDEIRGWREGASAYVTKPFNPVALSLTIQRALRRTPAEDDLLRHESIDLLEIDQKLSEKPQ